MHRSRWDERDTDRRHLLRFFFSSEKERRSVSIDRHCAGFYPPSPQDVLEIKLMHTLVKLPKVCWIDWWEHFVACVTLALHSLLSDLLSHLDFYYGVELFLPKSKFNWLAMITAGWWCTTKSFVGTWHLEKERSWYERWVYYIISSGLLLALGAHVFVCGRFSFGTSIYPPSLWFKSCKEVNEFFNCSLTPSIQNQLSHPICQFTFSVHCLK